MTSRLWCLALVLTAAAGCTSSFAGSARTDVPQPAPQTGTSDLEELKERVLELQRKSVMAEVEVERLRRQVAELEARLSDAGESGLRDGGMYPAPDPGVMETPPVIEESDLESEPVETAESVSAFEAGEAGVMPPSPSRPAEEIASGSYEPISAAAQAIYDRGYTLYHQGRYVDAETSFQQFLQGYPGTELTDNAQYWIGECRFARGDFRGSLAAFQMTVDRFPQGNKVADAILKMGDAHQALGESDRARERWEEVRRRFPGSAAAAAAEDRLAD
ncbi:MAG: tol-pal system protein YbgF [Thermoanaerobaculia bacterium]